MNLDKESFERFVENSLNFYGYLKNGAQETVPVFPTHIYVEPTNACNLDCPFCFTSAISRKVQFLDAETFRRTLENLQQNRLTPRITLTGEGEPFLHKQLEDMVEQARGAGFHVSIINNATLCDPPRAERMIRAGLNRIQFSIDSIEREVYDKLRKQKGQGDRRYFYRAMRNILTYAKLNYEAGRPGFISIASVQTSLNAPGAKSFREFWNRFPVDNVFLANLMTLQGNAPMEEAQAKKYKGPMKEKPVCVVPFYNLSVKADGDVVACSHDYDNTYPLGNIQRHSLPEMWNGAQLRKLRRALIDGEVDEFVAIGHDCRSCNMPLEGYGIAETIRHYHKSLAGASLAFLGARTEDPATAQTKYENLLEELPKWEEAAESGKDLTAAWETT